MEHVLFIFEFIINTLLKKKKHIESYFNYKEKKFPYYFKPKLKNQYPTQYFNKPLLINSVGLKYFGPTRFISIKPLKSVIRALKTYFRIYKLKNKIDFQIFIIPNIIFTSKPREIRMGKGKGQPESEGRGIIKSGQLVLELKFKSKINFFVLSQILTTCSSKLPYKFNFIYNFW